MILYFSPHLEYKKYTEEQEDRDGEKENTCGHVGVKQEISAPLGRIDLKTIEFTGRMSDALQKR